MTVKRAVFRCDAGPHIGGGHVARCLALADALSAAGWLVVFATNAEADMTVPGLSRYGHRIVLPPNCDAELPALREQMPDGVDLFVIDHYQRDKCFERVSRCWAQSVLVIDDFRHRPHDADIYVNPTPGDDAGLKDMLPPGCRVLTAPNYAPLRTEFARLRWRSLAHRHTGEAKRMFVCFGASDPTNASSLALDVLEQLASPLQADIVIGSAAPMLSALRQRVAKMPGVRLHVDTAEVADLMLSADLALGAAGSMSWERCALALPSIVIRTADNQTNNAVALAASHAGLDLGSSSPDLLPRLSAALCALLSDGTIRQAMAKSAAALCDALGSRRLMLEIDPPLAADGVLVRLRPARWSDCEIMHHWQSEPGARDFANDPTVSPLSEHQKWFAAKLSDPRCIFEVIEHGDEPAGLLRLDLLDDDTHLVSILISRRYRGSRVASAALEWAVRLLPGRKMSAEIAAENTASVRLFAAAGFLPDGARYLRRPAPDGDCKSGISVHDDASQ